MIERSVRLLLVVLVLLSGGAWLGGAAARAHGPRGSAVPSAVPIAMPDGEQAEASAADEPENQAEEAQDEQATESADQSGEDENAAAEDSSASEDADTSADASDAPTESGAAATAPADKATETEQERSAREAKELREKEERDIERAKKQDPCILDTPARRSFVKFVQSGAYLADFFVEWDSACWGAGKATTGGMTAGAQWTADFPSTATNIRIRATNQTGLVWQPTRTIFERTLPKVDGTVCFEVVGTTLGSSVKECQP